VRGGVWYAGEYEGEGYLGYDPAFTDENPRDEDDDTDGPDCCTYDPDTGRMVPNG
jgi:hypothetical protein